MVKFCGAPLLALALVKTKAARSSGPSCFDGGRGNPPLHVLFSEKHEKGRLSRRPFGGRSDVDEARGLEFVDDDARRDAMTAAIGGHTLGNLTSAADTRGR